MALFTCIISRRMELSRTRTQCCVILMLECTGILAAFSRLPPLARQTEVAYECPAVCVVRFLRIHRFPLPSPENRSSLRCRQKEKALISSGNQGFATFCFSSKWYHQESNRGHKDFQSFALPTELWHHP